MQARGAVERGRVGSGGDPGSRHRGSSRVLGVPCEDRRDVPHVRREIPAGYEAALCEDASSGPAACSGFCVVSWEIIEGDCLESLRGMADCSVDSIVTDPPYGLGKEPDALAMLRDWLDTGHHEVKGRGFMGKAWDAFVPQPEVWAECLRVLKPGGHLLAFGGTRTIDLVVLGIRIAGFEIRDQIASMSGEQSGTFSTLEWVTGTGFPKSLDVSKAIDAAAGADREVIGQGGSSCPGIAAGTGCACAETYGDERAQSGATVHAPATAPATEAAKKWDGWGTSPKPSHEPIVVARKPLEGTVAANVLKWGTGGSMCRRVA